MFKINSIKKVGYRRRLNKFTFIVVAFFAMLFFSHDAKATHIIGGEMNYTCLGNNEYELSLTVYRDCFYADPTVFFDDPAAIGIFDQNGTLVQGLLLPYLNNDTLTPILSDSCLFVPDDVCVHTASYKSVVNLPFKPGGYTFSYQRCCRNETIVNIVDPLNTGATFTATISEIALQECNSAPKFNSWPPLFICVNEPINFDHSAVDIEGDSIVYSLCTPYGGGDMINNQPQPPNAPPYTEISWLSPTFDVNNMLGFGIPLTIDGQTGLLSGTPTIKGQYVVGICMEEYRNGELISTIRRDFQYNVGDCGVVMAGILNDSIQCENLNVEFLNGSANANDFEWYYGDPANPGDFSDIANPSYEYPDTGVYTITLIAEPGGECADTSVIDIYLKNSTLSVDFSYFVLECVDSVVLSVNNASLDTGLGIETYDWSLNDGQTSNLENPIFVLNTSQEYVLNLEVETIDGCNESTEVTFFANVLNGSVQDTFALCPGDGINLNPAAYEGPNIEYTWSPSTGLDNPFATNPYASPTETTLYTVTISDTVNMCFGSYSLLVEIQEPNAVIINGDAISTCEESIELSASSDGIANYEWSDQADFSNIISTTSTYSANVNGIHNFYLRTTSDIGCVFTDEIEVSGGLLEVDALGYDDLACLNNAINFELINDDPFDILTINWTPAANVISGQNDLEVLFNPVGLGQNIFTAQIENQFGCSQTETFEVLVITDDSPSDFGMEQLGCEANEFVFTSDHPNNEYYEWHVNDPANPGVTLTGTSVSYTYSEPGTYIVELIPIEGMPCELQAISQTVIVPDNYFESGYDFSVTSCGDEIQVNFTELSTAFNDQIVNTIITFSNGEVFTASNFDLTFAQGGVYSFTVALESEKGCEFTYEGSIALDEVLIMDASFILESILSCDGEAVDINSNGNPNWDYFWTPSDGLSASNIMNPNANPTSTTVYTVLISDPSNGCSISRTITVEVPEVPLNADFEWSFLSCFEMAEIQFTDLSSYSNGNIIEWDWQFSNGQSYNDQNPIVIFDVEEEVSVTLTVITDDGCSVSLAQDIEVNLVSLNLPDPDDALFICLGESLELNPGGSLDYSYAWSPSTSLSSALAASPIATPEETTTYSVTVTDGTTGCQVQQEVTIEVSTEDPQASFEFEYLSCEGPALVQFTNTSAYADAAIVGYEWTFSNGETSSEENPTLSLNANETLLVTLNVTGEDGCSGSITETVQINFIDFTIQLDSLHICNQEAAELNQAADFDLIYSWSPSLGLSDANIPNPMANPEETTLYTVTISDPENGDCFVTREVLVTVPDYNINLDYDIAYLACGTSATVQLSDLSTAGIDIVGWEWSFNNGTVSTEQNPIFEVNETSTLIFDLTVTTADGCNYELTTPQGLPVVLIETEPIQQDTLRICMGESVILNENGNDTYSYSWEDNLGLSDINATSPSAGPLETTTYEVTITNVSIDTCQVTSSVTVMVYDDPIFEINGEQDICEEEGNLSVNLADGESIIWSENPNFNDVLSNEENIVVSPGGGTTYYAMITNDFGCGSEVQSFTMTSHYFEIDIEDGQTICLGDTIEISGFTIVGEEPDNWVWSDDASIIENLGASILVAPTGVTTYTLNATNNFGCNATTQTITIDVVDIASEVTVSADRDTIELGESVNLLAAGQNGYVYNWSPSIYLDDALSSNPVSTPDSSVIYTVLVEDENGCSTIGSVSIVVVYPIEPPPPPPVLLECEEPYVFLPNAFTPNGDNLNDELKVEGQEITDMFLTIYNRWGQKVFESEDQSKTWDGTFKGKKLDPDVFGYILRVTCLNGEDFYKQGNISLLK